MKLKGYKEKICVVSLASALLLSGCGFLPETEENRVAPIAQTLEQAYFEQVEVTSADISSKFEMGVSYKTKKVESLYFSVDDVRVETAYFKEGDAVKEGDLLVEGNSSQLKDSIAGYEESVNELTNSVNYYAKLVEIEESRKMIYAQYGVAFDDTNLVSYQESLDSETKLLNVSKLQLEEAQEKLENLRVYSPIDGTLSYVASPSRWQILNKGDIAASVIQDEERITTTGSLNEYIEVGGTYDCEVVTETYVFDENSEQDVFFGKENVQTVIENVMIEVTCKSIDCVNEESGVYEFVFVPVDSSVLSGVDHIPQCKVVVVLETVENATVVPKDVLISTSEGYAVYLEAEDGSRTIHNVEVGITENNMVQIISGLEVGQTVIGERINEEESREENRK